MLFFLFILPIPDIKGKCTQGQQDKAQGQHKGNQGYAQNGDQQPPDRELRRLYIGAGDQGNVVDLDGYILPLEQMPLDLEAWHLYGFFFLAPARPGPIMFLSIFFSSPNAGVIFDFPGIEKKGAEAPFFP